MQHVRDNIWQVERDEWDEYEHNVRKPGYYFSDEAYGMNGPYNTVAEAEDASERYFEWLHRPKEK